jgi:hypothetical protein
MDSEKIHLDREQKDWIRTSWYEELLDARNRRNRSRFWFRLLRFMAVAGAPLVAALAAINLGNGAPTWIPWATFGVSVVVALSAGGLQVFRFGTEWGMDEEYANALESEGWAYIQHAGKYRDFVDPGLAFDEFFDSIQKLRRSRNDQQIGEIITAASESTSNSNLPPSQ